MNSSDPIIIYQMGKVGSASVKSSLEMLNLPNPIFHVHFLSWKNIHLVEKLYRDSLQARVPKHINQSRSLRKILDEGDESIRWKVITLVRDPIAREISDLFQNLERDLPRIHLDDLDQATYEISEHFISALQSFDESNDYANCWFDEEIRDVFKFDVFSFSFNHQKGYQIYTARNADILLMRLEDLSIVINKALTSFLDISNVALQNENVGARKPYQKLYNRVLESISIPADILDNVYRSRFAKQFYSEKEIEKFKCRWSTKLTDTSLNLGGKLKNRNKTKRKILIIHPEGNINNNPNLTGIVEILCDNNFIVHIYSSSIDGIYQNSPCKNSELFLFQPKSNSILDGHVLLSGRPAQSWKAIIHKVNEKLGPYDLVIGIDRGIIEASIVAKALELTYGLISYEIMFQEETGSGFKEPEIIACQDLHFAVCQDNLRASKLSNENKFPIEKIISIPLAGRYLRSGNKTYRLYDQLCIDREKKIALMIGSISEMSMVSQLIENAKTWPDDWVLVLHNRYGLNQKTWEYYRKYQQQRNLYFSLNPVTDPNQLDTLLHSADLGIALYKSHPDSIFLGNNIRYIGMASGKLSAYLQHGIPVMVNNIGEFSDCVKKYELGMVIDENQGINLSASTDDLNRWKTNCCSFFDQKLDLNNTIEPLLNTIQKIGDQRKVRPTNAYVIETKKSDSQDKVGGINYKVENHEYLVSAIVSTYNAEGFICGCLEDLESQTIADRIEIVIINSGSQQNEEAIVKEFQKKYSNINYIKTSARETLYQAWNRGIKVASGKYITNANTDDRHRKDALEILAKTLDDHPEVGFAYADCLITEIENETFDQNSAQSCYIFPEFSVRQTLARQFFGPQPMWRKSVHQNIGYFNPDFIVAGDYDFFIRLGWKYRGIHVPQFLGLYCKRNDSVERANEQINLKEGHAIKSFYRNTIPIEDIYPLLRHCHDDSTALAAVFADFGNFCIQIFNDLGNAAKAYEKGLAYKSGALELLNNLLVVYGLQGDHDKAKEIRKHLAANRNLLPHGSLAKNDLEVGGRKPAKPVLLKIEHPVVNTLPRVIKGSLEHSIQKGKSLQARLKVQRQHQALENFNRAIEERNNGNFELSADLMENYRCRIDYELLEKRDQRSRKTPDVSVIIVAYNSNRNLLQCLLSLENQSHKNFEIIIIDNGKNEDVGSELEARSLMLIRSPINLFPSEGRNIGAHFARGKIIAFLDDDATVGGDYVAKIIQAFDQYEIYGLRGKILPKTDNQNNRIARHYDLGDQPIPAIINTEGNSAFLRRIYLEMEGMDPLLFGGEGVDLSYRIKKAHGDHQTIYVPGVKIIHDFAHHNDKLNEKLNRHHYMEKYLFAKHPGIHKWMSESIHYASNGDTRERGNKLIQEKPAPSTSYDIIMVWYQNDWGLYGRRNEMIARALAGNARIRQILHLEPPINLDRLRRIEPSACIDDNIDVNLQRIQLANNDGVWIFTPHTPDGLSESENRNLIVQQIRDVIDERQFKNLILWLYPPHELSELVLHEFSSQAKFIVSDCVDDHRKYTADEKQYGDVQRRYEKILKASSVVFCVSETLQNDFRSINPRTFYIPNAASDLNSAGHQRSGSQYPRPNEMIGIPGPVVGYVGALSFRIDCKLLDYIAEQKPEWNIVLIGTSPNPQINQLSRRNNVHVLGPKKHDQIHAYLSHFDVCIIPHEVNDVTGRMNPLKLYEYLQQGKPVVTTGVAGVEKFREVVDIADDPEKFLKAVENSLENDSPSKTLERIHAVKNHTWPRRVDQMLKLLLHGNSQSVASPIAFRDATPAPSYFRHARPDIQKLVPVSASRILDVGCGSGILGAALKQRQPCQVTGIEYVQEIAEEARKHLDEVYTGDVVGKIDQLPSGAYDCIILADILEHLAEPDMVLDKLKRCLTRNGRIVASIPNVRHWSVIRDLLEGRWDYTEAGILDRTHLRFFTRSSMMEMFQDAGLQVESVDETTLVNCTVPQSFLDGLKQTDVDIKSLAQEGKVYQYLLVAKAGSVLPGHAGNDKQVSIIILAHNQLDYTQKCISSIIEHTAQPLELIVVDNASTDGTAEFLERLIRQQHHGVSLKVIKNPENAGFAGGNNQGIAVARGDFILLLNNDVVVSPNWLSRMLACFEKDPRIGIVGPMSNYVSGPQLVGAVDYDTSTLAGLNAFSEIFAKQHEGKIQPYWRVVGFCMLIKRQVIDHIGGLDDRYGLGNFEDDDFSLRAALAGFKSVIAKDCFIHHFGHRTFTGAKIDMGASLCANWNIFKEKWGLPPDLAYGAQYDLSEIVKYGFDSSKHYIPVTKNTDDTINIKSSSPTVFSHNTDSKTINHQGGNDVKSFKQMYQEIKPLIENGWYDAAISALEKIVESFPDKAIAYQELGALYYKQGQTENALSSYRQAMQLEPENIEAQKNLADFYYAELGQADEALKIYENILVVAPDDIQTLLLAGHINVSMNRFESAREKYQQVLAVEPWNADARQFLEALDKQVARGEQSDGDKQGAVDKNVKTAADLYQEIEPLVSSGQTDAAIYALEELLVAYPEFALAHNDLGVLYYQQDDKTAAQLHYEHAARYEPANMTFQKNLADFYFVELKRIKEAMDIYVKVLEANPEDVETLLTAGHISVALQRHDDARDIYNRVLEIEPWNADARQFLEALDSPGTETVSGKSPREMYQEIQPMLNSGQPESAIAALQNLTELHPDFAVAHNDLGVLYYQQGQKEMAQSCYERAVQIQPDNMTFQKNLADFYFVECDRVQEAMDIYVRILEIHPEDIETLMTAGHISAALQRFDDARTIYERVLEIEPWNADARQCIENLDRQDKAKHPGDPLTNVNTTPVQGGSTPSVS